MKTEESLYIKILEWAYYRGEAGFKWEELRKEFNITDPQNHWVTETFRNKTEIIGLLSYKITANEHIYGLTAEGTAQAIQYLNLRESRVNSKRAERLAKWAIGIGIIVGSVQIIIGIIQIVCR